jgi:hypothetical protein
LLVFIRGSFEVGRFECDDEYSSKIVAANSKAEYSKLPEIFELPAGANEKRK